MKNIYYLFNFFILSIGLHADGLINFEEQTSEFVLETKQICIPGFEHAFNPSIIHWNGNLLLSFRFIPNARESFTSYFGVVYLNEDFEPIGEPQVVSIRDESCSVPSRADDARLIAVQDVLYFVYSDNPEPKISRAGFRVYVAELACEEGVFFLKNKECLSNFEGESKDKREKNWVPFDYQGNLLLSYSINPHVVFYPFLGTGECATIASTEAPIVWNWGPLRGGTPGLLVGEQYLSFFHSWVDMASVHSNGKKASHYFMGAYTFSGEPPFSVTGISSAPILGKNFYEGAVYQPYWKPICCVFPAGFVFDDLYVWVVYGRQDHEVWVVKLDKQGLLNSLLPIPVSQTYELSLAYLEETFSSEFYPGEE